MRLFIAINFSTQTKDKISSVQNKLKACSKGSYTQPENIHLTLAFLGEISSDKLDCIKQSMNQLSVPRINIAFSHIGCFQRNDGDIWWLGIDKNAQLFVLQRNLISVLSLQGFNIESRAFKPHITLGRRIHLSNKIDKGSLLDVPFETQISSISLMKSEQINGKLTYTEIYRHP